MMREKIKLNSKWAFCKGACEIPREIPREWYFVNLPHTWNGIDGQDGGNDYYRGRCMYAKRFLKSELPESERYYIEVGAANSSAEVYVNGRLAGRHDGGYSLFRFDVTELLGEENIIVIAADNSARDDIYPEMADFTFYGGLYRGVNMLCVSVSHFELLNFGGDGVKITPTVSGENARVDVEVWVENYRDEQEIRYTVSDKEDKEVASVITREREVSLFIEGCRLWRGIKDPYLYTLKAELISGEDVIDGIEARFGIRTVEIDAHRGFLLNGEEYNLRGVSRHQDREEIGNALLHDHEREDMRLICELGVNAVRLAHYQHSEGFYDLCDERGLLVWAEIPYISKHKEAARENTVTQLRELITQCYNHPSVAVWGISNEITMGGESEELLEHHKLLNSICHEMDKTRPTAIAAVSPCPADSPYLKITDAVAYNHYFGWYGGEVSMNGEWFDEFHREHPEIPIGCSEYGAEALNWHTSEPRQGDYTEEYQAYYHEEMIKQLFPRDYLWATFVWNMFDFGADARGEGGINGRNHKGLVTFDRKYKKDAFYAYKAWLSADPFVHICGKRYVDRVEDVTRVTVYSNLPAVELFADGVSLGKKKASDRFFRFDVKNEGITRLTARAGECTDEASIRKVDKFNEKYRLRERGAVLNWYDITAPVGRFSLNDKLSDIIKAPEGARLLEDVFKSFQSDMAGFEMTDAMRKMMGGFTLLRLINMMGAMGNVPEKEELLGLNERLNSIEKP